jgi:hypothetical protein
MVTPVRTPLGSTTSNRKTMVDVAPLPVGAAEPAWVGLFGITEFKPNYGTVSLTDTSDLEGEGFTQSEGFSAGWGGEGKCRRATQTTAPDEYDAGQELVRAAGQNLGGNRILVRFYEMEEGGPRVEAITGPANVTWVDDGGAVTAGSMASFTLVGAGKPTSRVHPGPAGA